MGLWTEYIVSAADLAPRTAGPSQLTSMGDRYPFAEDVCGIGREREQAHAVACAHQIREIWGQPADSQCAGVRGGVSGTKSRVKEVTPNHRGLIRSTAFKGCRQSQAQMDTAMTPHTVLPLLFGGWTPARVLLLTWLPLRDPLAQSGFRFLLPPPPTLQDGAVCLLSAFCF